MECRRWKSPSGTLFPFLLFVDTDLELRAGKGLAKATQGVDGKTETKFQVSLPTTRSLSPFESALVSPFLCAPHFMAISSIADLCRNQGKLVMGRAGE